MQAFVLGSRRKDAQGCCMILTGTLNLPALPFPSLAQGGEREMRIRQILYAVAALLSYPNSRQIEDPFPLGTLSGSSRIFLLDKRQQPPSLAGC